MTMTPETEVCAYPTRGGYTSCPTCEMNETFALGMSSLNGAAIRRCLWRLVEDFEAYKELCRDREAHTSFMIAQLLLKDFRPQLCLGEASGRSDS